MSNMYAWIHEYKDTTGKIRYTVAISPVKPPVGTSYITCTDEDAPFLYVDETTMTIKDNRQNPNYINQLKQKLINDLKQQTYNYITKYMPLWRQNSWSEFIRCYDKMQTTSLTKAEQLTITEMTDKLKLSPSEVYDKCQQALEWIIQCKLADEEMEQKINTCTTYEQVKDIDITKTEYPTWPLGEE